MHEAIQTALKLVRSPRCFVPVNPKISTHFQRSLASRLRRSRAKACGIPVPPLGLLVIQSKIRTSAGILQRQSLTLRPRHHKKALPAREFEHHKMLELFKERHPEVTVGYETYRSVFNSDFNIGFGYPHDILLYMYDETVAKKGADKVCSMLQDFLEYYLVKSVKDVEFFCDGCGGQNNNFTVIRFLHHSFTKKSGLPIRGHSYLDCDLEMVNVNVKADVDVPED
ncbi:hypothetical protein RRG08_030771 [Elysia crispata]|uniref:Uncharacterized protein n=1 Tax=Elysia crispata TaxID=231223 RepID=A0AAE1CXK9_9GAST|nr:hypothetical protein RRG08_030771 [Elysia crispata]